MNGSGQKDEQQKPFSWGNVLLPTYTYPSSFGRASPSGQSQRNTDTPATDQGHSQSQDIFGKALNQLTQTATFGSAQAAETTPGLGRVRPLGQSNQEAPGRFGQLGFGQPEPQQAARQERAGDHTSIGALTNAFTDVQTRLTLVLDTLDTTQERLATFEKSLIDNQAQLATTQMDLIAARTELSLLKGTVHTLETKAAKPDSSPAHSMSMSKRKVPSPEAKSFEAGQAFGDTEKRHPITDSPLGRPVDRADRQIPQREANLGETVRSSSLDTLQAIQERARRLTAEIRGEDLATKKPSSLSPVDVPFPMHSTFAVQDRAANSDRQLPSVEAKLDALEKSFGETKKDISIMRKLLRTRLPAVESKAETLEKSVGQVQEELSGVESTLAISGGQLASMALRVVTMEDSLRAIRAGAQQDPGLSRGSRGHSPPLFPGQPRESRNSTPSPSREAAFFNREDSDSDVDR